MSLPNNPDYAYLAKVALDINLAVSELTGHQLRPLNQEIFIDLPGHQLTWHFDDNNYKVLLQVYLPKPTWAHTGMWVIKTLHYLPSTEQTPL